MDKCNDELHSIEKESKNTSTKDEYTIQNTSHDLPSNLPEATHGGETRLHSNITGIIPSVTNTIDERFKSNSTTVTAIVTCNPANIMPRLIKAYKKDANYGILLLSLITIGTIIASSVCFVLAKQNEHKRLNKIKPLTYGIIIAITSLILFMIVYVSHIIDCTIDITG